MTCETPTAPNKIKTYEIYKRNVKIRELIPCPFEN